MALRIYLDNYSGTNNTSHVEVSYGWDGGVRLDVEIEETRGSWEITSDEARCIATALVHYANTVD